MSNKFVLLILCSLCFACASLAQNTALPESMSIFMEPLTSNAEEIDPMATFGVGENMYFKVALEVSSLIDVEFVNISLDTIAGGSDIFSHSFALDNSNLNAGQSIELQENVLLISLGDLPFHMNIYGEASFVLLDGTVTSAAYLVPEL